MGIYVPFLKKMPSRCKSCPIIDGTDCRARNPYYLDETGIARPKNCPLIELPEKHGDLIDRDTLQELYSDGDGLDLSEFNVKIAVIRLNIDDMPAIIEAEGSP